MVNLCICLIANPPNYWFPHSFLEFPIEVSLFKQKVQVDHAELGHLSWTWKNDRSVCLVGKRSLKIVFYIFQCLVAQKKKMVNRKLFLVNEKH